MVGGLFGGSLERSAILCLIRVLLIPVITCTVLTGLYAFAFCKLYLTKEAPTSMPSAASPPQSALPPTLLTAASEATRGCVPSAGVESVGVSPERGRLPGPPGHRMLSSPWLFVRRSYDCT